MKRPIILTLIISFITFSCSDFLEPKSKSEFVPKDANSLVPLCLRYHGVCHGVGIVLLQAGGQPQHFGFLLGAERYHLSHPGAGVGQGAGLVKDDGIGSRHSLQEFAALDGDVGASRLPHGGKVVPAVVQLQLKAAVFLGGFFAVYKHHHAGNRVPAADMRIIEAFYAPRKLLKPYMPAQLRKRALTAFP